MNINDLIDFIKNNPPKGEYWGYSEWERNLTDNVPDWKSLVRDSQNWELIEKAEPRRSWDNLCEVFVNTVGIELAIRWFSSPQKDLRKGCRDWLESLVFENILTSEIWKKLTDEMKEYLIFYTFDRFPGEPFETLRDFVNKMIYLHYRGRISPRYIPISLPLPYYPSREILFLKSIIAKAEDKKFLKIVDEMIKTWYEKPIATIPSLRFPYTPTEDERELIARVMDKFRANGFMLSSLPQIFLSLETPPLFIAYPELEEENEERESKQNNDEPRIPRNRQRGRPETISIEEVLGCYLPNPTIILYMRGIKWCAKRYNLDEELLRGIVLIHEMGRWVTHLLPGPNGSTWPTEIYKLTSTEVHEGWAQLITWWVVNETGGEIKQVFENLNKHQSHPYQVFNDFTSKPINNLIKSLELLRQLRWPAGINDWKRLIPYG